MRVILCGYNWVGCKSLKTLIEKGHEVFVYTHENPSHVNSLIELCEKLKVRYSTERISSSIIPFKPDIICSIYYRYIIPNDLIEIVQGKIFNLHPSLLPDYRGCSSLTWAMINGEKKVGFTYHYIDQNIDTGRIILQKELEIEDWDTQVTLYHRTMFEAGKDFYTAFQMVQNEFPGHIQRSTGNYYKRGCPFNGEINPEWDQSRIERFIRAMNYPPLTPAKLGGKEIKTFSEYVKEFKLNG